MCFLPSQHCFFTVLKVSDQNHFFATKHIALGFVWFLFRDHTQMGVVWLLSKKGHDGRFEQRRGKTQLVPLAFITTYFRGRCLSLLFRSRSHHSCANNIQRVRFTRNIHLNPLQMRQMLNFPTLGSLSKTIWSNVCPSQVSRVLWIRRFPVLSVIQVLSARSVTKWRCWNSAETVLSNGVCCRTSKCEYSILVIICNWCIR